MTRANTDAAIEVTDSVVKHGTAGNDSLTGTSGDDSLDGQAGADTLTGGDGRDWLFAGPISPLPSFPTNLVNPIPPIFDTGPEHDVLNAGTSDDFVFAGAGDSADGGDGDELFGDTLYISFRYAPHGVIADFRPMGNGAPVAGVKSASMPVSSCCTTQPPEIARTIGGL